MMQTSICRPQRAPTLLPLLPFGDEMLEGAAAMPGVFELVETGAGRSEENDFAGASGVGGGVDGFVEGFAGVKGDDAAEVGLDFGSGGADGVDGTDAFAQQRGEEGVVRAFVFAAEDEVNAGREGGDCFGRGVDVGGLESL